VTKRSTAIRVYDRLAWVQRAWWWVRDLVANVWALARARQDIPDLLEDLRAARAALEKIAALDGGAVFGKGVAMATELQLAIADIRAAAYRALIAIRKEEPTPDLARLEEWVLFTFARADKIATDAEVPTARSIRVG